jgi:hypothetical protein
LEGVSPLFCLFLRDLSLGVQVAFIPNENHREKVAVFDSVDVSMETFDVFEAEKVDFRESG